MDPMPPRGLDVQSMPWNTRKDVPGIRALRRAWPPTICLLIGLLILTLWPEAPPVGSAAVNGCERYASMSGSNSAPGTKLRPFRTAQKLADSLRRGETGCFRAGTYSFSTLNLSRSRVRLAPYGSEAVTLRGDIKVMPGGAHSVIEGMTLNAATGSNQIGPRIYANAVTLRDNQITNQHTGICVQIGRYRSRHAPRDVKVSRNRIHDCGRLPATNHHHGIYVSAARHATIRGNWIYDNADRGVQLYPAAHGSLVTDNVIDSNGQGVNFGGDASSCSNNNTVTGNVIANSKIRWNAYSGEQGGRCTGNVVRRNCVYGSNSDAFYNTNGGIETPSKNFSAKANTAAPPQYVSRPAGDFRLQPSSPCEDLLGSG